MIRVPSGTRLSPNRLPSPSRAGIRSRLRVRYSPGENTVASRGEVCRYRHLPRFTVSEAIVPQAGWQTGTQGLPVVAPPRAVVFVHKMQELGKILATSDITAPGKSNVQVSPGSARCGNSTASSAYPLSNAASGAVDEAADTAGSTSSPRITCDSLSRR